MKKIHAKYSCLMAPPKPNPPLSHTQTHFYQLMNTNDFVCTKRENTQNLRRIYMANIWLVTETTMWLQLHSNLYGCSDYVVVFPSSQRIYGGRLMWAVMWKRRPSWTMGTLNKYRNDKKKMCNTFAPTTNDNLKAFKREWHRMDVGFLSISRMHGRRVGCLLLFAWLVYVYMLYTHWFAADEENSIAKLASYNNII